MIIINSEGAEMASTGRSGRSHVVSQEAAMAGILAILVEEREKRTKGEDDAAKTEVLLAHAGLSNDDIAAVMGKSSDAVRKVIERKNAPTRKGT
jgi:hypothetical protein